MHSPTPEPAKAGFIRSRGVTAKEMYAILEANNSPRPRCECHDAPMNWHKDSARVAGGRWRCYHEHRERLSRWREKNLESVRITDRERSRKRRLDPAYRLWMLQYQTLYEARKLHEKATKTAEEMYA